MDTAHSAQKSTCDLKPEQACKHANSARCYRHNACIHSCQPKPTPPEPMQLIRSKANQNTHTSTLLT